VQHWEKIAIIGVGLLGGSIGLAARGQNLARRVEGYVRREEVIKKCQDYGVVDKASCNLDEIVSGADLIILCTPLSQMKSLVERMRGHLKKGAIVTDVGSAKAKVVSELEPLVSELGGEFIGGHPMAGSEKTGVDASISTLFNGAVCVLTPTKSTRIEPLENVKEFWHRLGARVLLLSPEDHDLFVSRSSHLPHIVANQLARYVLNPVYPIEQAMLCSSGFRDTTRIASSSPEMWRDICLANREKLINVLEEFIKELENFKSILGNGNGEKIEEFFKTAKRLRDSWIEQGHSPE